MKSLTKIAILAGAAGAAAYVAVKKFVPENSKEKLKETAQNLKHKAAESLNVDEEKADEVISKIGSAASTVTQSAKNFVAENINPEGPLAESFNEFKETLASKINDLETVSDFPVDWMKFLGIYEKNMSEGVSDDIERLGQLKLTHDELLSQFTLWAFMGAPLNVDINIDGSTDDEETSEEIKDLFSITENEDVIKIKEDNLNKSSFRIKSDEFEDIILKPLENDEFAVCFFNKRNEASVAELNLQTAAGYDFIETPVCDCYDVYDLWTKETFPIKDDLLKYVPAHGTRSFRIKAKK